MRPKAYKIFITYYEIANKYKPVFKALGQSRLPGSPEPREGMKQLLDLTIFNDTAAKDYLS